MKALAFKLYLVAFREKQNRTQLCLLRTVLNGAPWVSGGNPRSKAGKTRERMPVHQSCNR